MKVSYLSVVAKDGLTPAERFASLEKAQGTFYIVGDDLYFEDKKITNAADIEAIDADLSDLEAALIKLENTEETTGSIRNIIRSYLNASEVAVADTDENFEGTTVEACLAELADMISGTSTAGEVTVTKTTGGPNDDYVTRYAFSQGGTAITNGTIDILKDMVATSGQIVYPTTSDPITVDGQQVTDGTYIELTIANGTPFYVNVASLIEYNTFTNTSVDGEIVVTDNNHSITMAIGKVAASKIIYRAADTTDPENPVTEQTVAQKIAELESTSAAGIANLDADVDATGTAQHSGTFVVSGITQVDGLITAVDSVEVETAGAAAAVLGTASDASTAATVYGAKALTHALETYVGEIPASATATDVIGYIDEKVDASLTWDEV